MGFLKLIVQVFLCVLSLTWVGSKGGGPKGGGPKGGGPKGGGPKGGGPKGGGPEGWGAQNFALFFPVSPQNSFFLPSLGVFSWCLKRRDAQMCTCGVLSLSCEAPAAPKPPGFHTTTREPKRAHLRVPVFKNTTKIPRKRPTKEGKKNKKLWWEREKKREISGPHRSGPHPSPPPPPRLFLGLAPHLLGPHHDTKNIGQKIGLAKKRTGQNWSNQDG